MFPWDDSCETWFPFGFLYNHSEEQTECSQNVPKMAPQI